MNGGGEQRGVFDVDEDQALDAMALACGDAYQIYVVDGQWQAWQGYCRLADQRPPLRG